MSLNHVVRNGALPLLDINVNSVTLLPGQKPTVSQVGNINTGVTINYPCGTIFTVANPNIANSITRSFTVTNSTVNADSQVMVSWAFPGSSSGATGIAVVGTSNIVDGSFIITVSNAGSVALTIPVSIDFVVL